jgi:DNA-binding YbaB/EbfC family protein
MFNMNPMKLMEDILKESQNKLSEIIVENSTCNDLVIIKLNALKQLVEIEINPELLNKHTVESLQEVLKIAFDEALTKADEAANHHMGQYTGGFKLPPGLF